MPRPTKAFRRMKINATIAYKRGDREEAYKLWEKAAAGYRDHREKKRTKNKPPEVEAATAEPAAATAESAG